MEPNIYKCCECGKEAYYPHGWLVLQTDPRVTVMGDEEGPWLFCCLPCLITWSQRAASSGHLKSRWGKEGETS